MKLLLDQNLSDRLLPSLQGAFPDSTHVKLQSLDTAGDQMIWEFAKRDGFVIVSQDIDFYERVRLLGHPPKVVYLRCGNTSTKHLAALLKLYESVILAFGKDPKTGCLELL